MNKRNIKNEIIKYISASDYLKGEKYFKGYINYINTRDIKTDIVEHSFRVESERTLQKYFTFIRTTKDGEIYNLSCSCKQFETTDSCKHIAACIINYYDDIFKIDDSHLVTNITNQIFNKFNKPKSHLPKQEVRLDIELITDAEDDITLEAKIKIGLNKLYSLNSVKLDNLFNAIKNEDEELFLGKEFTFNSKLFYFNNTDLKILNFLKNKERYSEYGYYNYYRQNNKFKYSDDTSKELLNLLKNKKYKLNNTFIDNISTDNMFLTELKENDDKYELIFKINDNIAPLTSDYEYIQKNNTIYKLNSNKAELLEMLLKNNLDRLVFDKDKLDIFSKSVLPIIKDTISIDNNINLVISSSPTPRLYFDMYFNSIVCNLKFLYDDSEVNYFDINNNVLRDEELENEVLNELYLYKFNIEDNKIIMDDVDDIGEFIESGLILLSEKYETFTSKKIKNIEIVKNSNISSTFSIGKDNIMSYSFDFGEIEKEEISKVLSSLRQNKKYYHLKNGNIINLEHNNNLNELNHLATDMELKDSDLREDGTIPKYQAIYLDSIKDTKYSIIKTDNLFKDLINRFNSYKNIDITLNNKDKKILRDYQITGIKWLYTIYKTGFGGILADEMGLGKSIQTIYFIKEVLKENKNAKFLIIAPTSLAYNWEREFDKFADELNYTVIVGSRDKRRKDLKKKTNILITTYGLIREDIDFYREMDFVSIIIDEAQNIKNPNTAITKAVKSIKADSMFALTGTPIENSVIELWSIFDYIMPGFLSSLIKFKNKYKVKEFDDETNNLLNSLNKQVAPFILRRRKKDVIKELPDKIENNIYIDLLPAQKKLYVAELERIKEEFDNALANGGINKVKFMILQLLTKLRQLCIDPRIIFENYKDGSEKMNTLIKIINELVDNNHKILLFTSFKSALDLVKKELDKNNFSSYTIDGAVSSKKRMELVDKFNSDNTNAFLIMLKAGGTGLNLTSADIVIHLDLWWNPQAENQATDRTHRIGQTNKVEVIKLITKGTIEEKILDLQKKKKLLSDKLIDTNNEENLLSELSEKDLRNLLAFENKDE